jgi:hypothetical protein
LASHSSIVPMSPFNHPCERGNRQLGARRQSRI